jgi:ubiquinone/menaquinone biosynthesis C-methylase UbiE
MLSIADWDERYQQQAGWTSSIRSYLFQKYIMGKGGRILDVGCGTGVIGRELNNSGYNRVFGVDFDYSAIRYSTQQSHSTSNTVGNAYQLPFDQGNFDVVICHFLLMWLNDPVSALVEMKRVLKPGGEVFLLAEPDHAARIDFPPEFERLGNLQTQSLVRQGANTQAGRQIGAWLSEAGFKVGETGIMGGQWNMSADEIDLEWRIIDFDLGAAEAVALKVLQQQDLDERKAGRRVMFVPIFFAQGFRY